MIYKFSIKDDNNRDKIFYLTADDQKKLYRRIASTYGVLKDEVKLLAEYAETDDYSYELKKSYGGNSEEVVEKDKKIISKAKTIFSKNRRLTGDYKLDYVKRMKFSEIGINNEKDLYPLLRKYKKVKVYFETGEKRGTRRYYALVR